MTNAALEAAVQVAATTAHVATASGPGVPAATNLLPLRTRQPQTLELWLVPLLLVPSKACNTAAAATPEAADLAPVAAPTAQDATAPPGTALVAIALCSYLSQFYLILGAIVYNYLFEM